MYPGGRQGTPLITPPQCSFVTRLEQLGFNALLQLMIGVPLEMVHGVLRISLLYLAGVLAGETSTLVSGSPAYLTW